MVFEESEEDEPLRMSHDQRQTGFARRAPMMREARHCAVKIIGRSLHLHREAAARRAGDMK